MKKHFLILLMSYLCIFCYPRTQRYRDNFYIENYSHLNIEVKYSFSKVLFPIEDNGLVTGFYLDLGEKKIALGTGHFYHHEGTRTLEKNGFAVFNSYAFDYSKYYKMGWFARFLLISGELIVKDENGNILINLDTITPEDFEVTEESGITTATLVIRDK